MVIGMPVGSLVHPVAALCGTLVIAAAGATGYWFGTTEAPPTTTIATTACGIAGGQPPVAVPLHLFARSGGDIPILIGPIEVPGAGPPVSIRFDRVHDGVRGKVFLIGNVIHLPPTFGRDQQVPEKITLGCRDGTVGIVSYRVGRQTATFSVTRQQPTDPVAAAAAAN